MDKGVLRVKYVVVNSPWPTRLPNGTEIVPCEPREGKDGKWFIKANGALLFPKEKDGKFRLFDSEFEEVYV